MFDDKIESARSGMVSVSRFIAAAAIEFGEVEMWCLVLEVFFGANSTTGGGVGEKGKVSRNVGLPIRTDLERLKVCVGWGTSQTFGVWCEEKLLRGGKARSQEGYWAINKQAHRNFSHNGSRGEKLNEGATCVCENCGLR